MRPYIAMIMIASLTAWPGNQTTIVPDLGNVVNNKDWKIFNRSIRQITEDGRKAVRFDVREGGGLAILPGVKFDNGEIEFDVKGKNVLQKSFVGIAFHGLDENTFDLIYFRPFNFTSEDSTRRAHSVQYVSPPEYGWKMLREKYPGVYEQPVLPVPDPDAWFHARVIVEYPNVSVFVNNSEQPCLAVEKLNQRRTGWVGFFVGDSSDGSFANLKITSKISNP